MELHGKQIIGRGISAKGNASSQAQNPVTGELLAGAFHHATAEELKTAVTLAEQAWRELEATSVEQRADFLDRIGAEIMRLGDALLERCNLETALPPGRLEAERARTCNQLGMFAKLVREGTWVDARIETPQPDRKPLPKPDLRLLRRSLGPVVVFCASNFPLAFSVAGGDTASALAGGNPVLVKAHHAHPGSAELVGRAIQQAADTCGMPEGVFSLLHGPGREIGSALVRHPSIKAVGFTGSRTGGRALYDLAVSRPSPIPVYAEMSSINPVFVLSGAARERGQQIASGLSQSVTLGVGQFCTCPGVVVVEAGRDSESFLRIAARLLAESARGTMLSAGIYSAYLGGVRQLQNRSGVRLLEQQDAMAESSRNRAVPALFRTEATTFLADELLREEVFGPITVAVVCASKQELHKVAAVFQGELTATIHGNETDLDGCQELIAMLEERVGRLVYGGFPTGVEVCSAMHHGGPYPATTDVHFTSVGTAAIYRFSRPVCYQNAPDRLLPDELKDANPRGIWRLVDDELTKKSIG